MLRRGLPAGTDTISKEHFAVTCRFLLALVSFALFGASASAQTSGMSIVEPKKEATEPRQDTTISPARQAVLTNLRAVAIARCTNAPAHVTSALRTALVDITDNVRAEALEVIAACRMSSRYSDTAPEAEALKALRPDVRRLLRDPNPRVRGEAVDGLMSLDAAGLKGRMLVLPHDTYVELKAIYDTDPSPIVRSRIVRAFAQTAGGGLIQESVLLQALHDPDPSVVSFAVRGVGEYRLIAGLPNVGALLLSPDRNVRLAAAQSLAAFDRDALPFLGRLRQAIAVEPSEIIRKTMEGTEGLLLRLQEK